MKHTINIIVLSIFTLLFPLILSAQQKVEMADQFRADGKIYVVIGVLVIILIILLFFVFRIDRKITRLENRFNNKT